MAQLYSLGGTYPTELPWRIKFSDGTTRTDPSTFTLEEIQRAGYVAVAEKPQDSFDVYVGWDFEVVDWIVRARTQEEKDAIMNDLKQEKLYLLLEIYDLKIETLNKHISYGSDGMEVLESNVKVARKFAELIGQKVFSWIRTNTALNPNDSDVLITNPEFIQTLRSEQIFSDILDLLANKNSKRNQIQIATTPDELDAIDIESGWII